MEKIMNPSIRALILYLFLLLLARILGRKMISQMTFFDFVIGITIGSVAATNAIGPYVTSLASGISVLATMGALVLIIEYIGLKSFRFKKLVDSEPLVVIERGQIVDRNLRRERLTIKELTALLREKNIFNLADVEYAIFERDGKLSVLQRSERQYMRPSDMNITPPYQGLSKDIIVDGKILKENLEDAAQNLGWLIGQLKNHGVSEVKDVFYAGLDSQGNLYVSKRNTKYEKEGKYGIE